MEEQTSKVISNFQRKSFVPVNGQVERRSFPSLPPHNLFFQISPCPKPSKPIFFLSFFFNTQVSFLQFQSFLRSPISNLDRYRRIRFWVLVFWSKLWIRTQGRWRLWKNSRQSLLSFHQVRPYDLFYVNSHLGLFLTLWNLCSRWWISL